MKDGDAGRMEVANHPRGGAEVGPEALAPAWGEGVSSDDGRWTSGRTEVREGAENRSSQF